MDDRAIGLSLILLSVHWIPLLIGAWRYPMRGFDRSFGGSIKFGLSILCCLLVVIFLFVFLQNKDLGSRTGHSAGWYLIYSVVTVGIVPALVITIHVVAGRFLGWWWRQRRRRSE